MHTKVATLYVIAICLLAVNNGFGQNPPLSLGALTVPQELPNNGACPSGAGFFPGTVNGNAMQCFSTTVSCPGAASIPLVFGYLPGIPNPVIRGTIVLMPGSGGDLAGGDGVNLFVLGPSYDPRGYPSSGYNVVELAWGVVQSGDWTGMPWEDTTNGCVSNCTTPSSIRAAACRPATFLHYIAGNPTYHTAGTGMCAQGISGGSGAVAYTMAWYGGTNFLDKVELLSGPVFSNIELGCEVPYVSGSPVCQGSPSFCQSGGASWTSAPYKYSDSVIQAMREFTGDSTCRLPPATSFQSDQNWLHMSIVDTNASFAYPNTAVTGFACGSINPNAGMGMNNSSTEGWTFFNNPITASGSYYFYNVQNCSYDEGVYGDGSQVPALPSSPAGYTAIFNDMISGNPALGTPLCQNLH